LAARPANDRPRLSQVAVARHIEGHFFDDLSMQIAQYVEKPTDNVLPAAGCFDPRTPG